VWFYSWQWGFGSYQIMRDIIWLTEKLFVNSSLSIWRFFEQETPYIGQQHFIGQIWREEILKRRIELKEKTVLERKYYNSKIIEKGIGVAL